MTRDAFFPIRLTLASKHVPQVEHGAPHHLSTGRTRYCISTSTSCPINWSHTDASSTPCRCKHDSPHAPGHHVALWMRAAIRPAARAEGCCCALLASPCPSSTTRRAKEWAKRLLVHPIHSARDHICEIISEKVNTHSMATTARASESVEVAEHAQRCDCNLGSKTRESHSVAK